jgi:hypothetical protein
MNYFSPIMAGQARTQSALTTFVLTFDWFHSYDAFGMKALRRVSVAILCVLTAAGSLLTLQPVALAASACRSETTQAVATKYTGCSLPCCEGKPAGALACSCCLTTHGKPASLPFKNCSACPCGTPPDTAPPSSGATANAPPASVAASLAALDCPAPTVAANHTLLTHHPPPEIDLVISLSRLTC